MEDRDTSYILKSQRGSVLILAMVILVLITLLAVYAANTSTTELKIAANYQRATAALYAAESGIEEVRGRLLNLIESAPCSVSWKLFLGDVSLGFNPDIAEQIAGFNPEHCLTSNQEQLFYLAQIRFKTEQDSSTDLCGDGLAPGDVRYWGVPPGTETLTENPAVCGAPPAGMPIVIVDVWGKGLPYSQPLQNASLIPDLIRPLADSFTAFAAGAPSIHHLTVELRWQPLPYVLFADEELVLGEGCRIEPVSGTSDYAHVGVNGTIRLENDVIIRGRINLGRNKDGRQAVVLVDGTSGAATSLGFHKTPRIDPDPLQLDRGRLAKIFSAVEMENDNLAGATPAVVDQRLALQNQAESVSTMTLAVGNYYLSELQLDPGTTLIIDNRDGPVKIYCTGIMEINAGACLVTLGAPADFVIYNSSSETLKIEGAGDFKGVLYAPDAEVNLSNSGATIGMIWARKITLKHGARVKYEPHVQNRFFPVLPRIVWWRDDS